MAERQQKLQFPQRFDMKIIVSATVPIAESKASISRVFSECAIMHHFVNARASAKGNYISYCYTVDFDGKEQMDKTYKALQQVPKIKFAL